MDLTDVCHQAFPSREREKPVEIYRRMCNTYRKASDGIEIH